MAYDRNEFRKYLEDSGAVESLSRVFLKLYELKGNRPKSSIKFIQEHITDTLPSVTEYEKLREDLIAMGGILQQLKLANALDSAQLAVFDQISTINRTADACGDTSKTIARISARHSQIVKGNAWKKGADVVASKIRLSNKSDMPAYTAKIERAIEDLKANTQCNSLLKAHIGNFYDKYKANDAENVSFVECICSGLDIPESAIGVYATDAGAYDKFKEFFKIIIEDYHKGFDFDQGTHPPLNWGDPKSIPEISDAKKYIVWTRIRCIRNVQGHKLVPKMDKNELETLCGEVKVAFDTALTADDVKGNWYELDKVDSGTKKELIAKSYILEYGDKFLESVGATNHWPSGRAVYIHKKEKIFVWINEEDHLRFISMDSDSKIGDIYGRLKLALEAVAKSLKFQVDPKLGFVSLCPTNLGNTIRASVMIRLPKLTNNKTDLDALIAKHNFEIRQGNSDTIEISNKEKLGLTEIASIGKFCSGVREIIEKEKNS